MPITVRNLEPSDAPAASLLVMQLTKNVIEPENLTSRITALVKMVNGQYMVAEKDGQLVGFGGLMWYQIPSKGLVGQIEEVVTDEKFRKQGIATELMRALVALARARGLVQIKLTAKPGSGHVYESVGFVQKEESVMLLKLT